MERQELYDKIHEAFDEWVVRLDGENYHGGNQLGPDACDFRMYSEISRVGSLAEIKGIMKAREDSCKFV